MKIFETSRQEAKNVKNVSDLLDFLRELTPEEAYQLLNSKNWMAIIYAMRNVNSEDLAKLREIIIKELIN
jgi:hypothetical protein